jgi:hypothetical protein
MLEYEKIGQRVDVIYKLIGEMTPDQSFLIAQLANYTCILLSAYIERAIVEIIEGYCTLRGSPTVAAFVSGQIGKFQNPSSDKVEKLLAGFGEPIIGRVKALLTDESRSAIDSVVSNRNNLAHGRNATVTFSMLKGWDKEIRRLIASLKNEALV